MHLLNDNPFVEKIKSVVENYMVMFILSSGPKYIMKVTENHNKSCSIFIREDGSTIIHFIIHSKDKINIYLNKHRFPSGIFLNHKLKNMKIVTSEAGSISAWQWHIQVDNIEGLNNVMKVVSKKM